jgi:signal transduction histidine kinase
MNAAPLPRPWSYIMALATAFLLIVIGQQVADIGRPDCGLVLAPFLRVAEVTRPALQSERPVVGHDRVRRVGHRLVTRDSDWWEALDDAYRRGTPLPVELMHQGVAYRASLALQRFTTGDWLRKSVPMLGAAALYVLTGWLALFARRFDDVAKVYVGLAATTAIYLAALADATLFHRMVPMAAFVSAPYLAALLWLATSFPHDLAPLRRHLVPWAFGVGLAIALPIVAIRFAGDLLPWEQAQSWHGTLTRISFLWIALCQLATAVIFVYQARLTDRGGNPSLMAVSLTAVLVNLLAALFVWGPYGLAIAFPVPFRYSLLASALMPLGFVYLIGKEGYWDLRMAWRRSMLMLVVGGSLGAIGAAVIHWLPTLLGFPGQTWSWITVTAVLLVSLAYIPVREAWEGLLDRWLFAAPYDAAGLQQHLGERLASLIDPHEVATDVIVCLEAGPMPVMAWLEEQVDGEPARVLASLGERHAGEIVLGVPIVSRGRPLGRLCLGPKRSERPYDLADRAFIDQLVHQAALALDRSLLFAAQQEALAVSERLRETAETALQVRDDFLSVASHELRTPVTVLRLQVDALRRRQGKEPGPVDLGRFSRQIDRMERLILDLLNEGEISRGQLTLQPAAVDLQVVVAEVIADLDAAGTAANSPFITHLSPVPAVIDPQRVGQIVLNLLQNAIKFGAGKPVEVSLQADGGDALITVCDHGIGIAPDDQQRLFMRFSRISSPRHYGGFGLGLWISQWLAQGMGGTITVASQPGHGSTFTVRLPVHAPAAGQRSIA